MVQRLSTSACHAEDRGFESHWTRKMLAKTGKIDLGPAGVVRRQLMIAPDWGEGGRVRLILLSIGDSLSTTPEEEIRLDYKRFPAIGIIRKGAFEISFLKTDELGIPREEISHEVELLLKVNGLA